MFVGFPPCSLHSVSGTNCFLLREIEQLVKLVHKSVSVKDNSNFRESTLKSKILSNLSLNVHLTYYIFVSNFTRLTAREITYNNFEISLLVFMPNITTNHAITYTNPRVDFVLFFSFAKERILLIPFFITF